MAGCGAVELPVASAREVLLPCALRGRARPRSAPLSTLHHRAPLSALPHAWVAGALRWVGANLRRRRTHGDGERGNAPDGPDVLTGHDSRGAIHRGRGNSRCCRRPPGPGRGSPSQPCGRRRCAAGTASVRRFPQPSKSSLVNVPELPLAQCLNLGLGTGARGPAAAGWAITELPTLFSASEKSLIQEGDVPSGARCFVSRIAQSPDRSHFPVRCLNWIFSKYSPSPPSVWLRCGNGGVLL